MGEAGYPSVWIWDLTSGLRFPLEYLLIMVLSAVLLALLSAIMILREDRHDRVLRAAMMWSSAVGISAPFFFMFYWTSEVGGYFTIGRPLAFSDSFSGADWSSAVGPEPGFGLLLIGAALIVVATVSALGLGWRENGEPERMLTTRMADRLRKLRGVKISWLVMIGVGIALLSAGYFFYAEVESLSYRPHALLGLLLIFPGLLVTTYYLIRSVTALTAHRSGWLK